MSKMSNISARPLPAKVNERVVKNDKSVEKPEVDIQALHKDLQNKRNLLNVLEKKGVAHKIDVKAIDKALADLDAIIESRGKA